MNREWRKANGKFVAGNRGHARILAALLVVVSVAARPAIAQSGDASQKTTPVVQPTADSTGLAFRVAKIVVMDDADHVVNDAIVLVKNGKIEAAGGASEVKIPAGYRQYDLRDQWLVPGMVDCHDHVAGNLGDLNDMVYQTNPGLDTRATIDPNNYLVSRARSGGVTTVMLIPGSGTNMSGFGTVTKTGGDSPQEVIVRSPGSLKIAQAGNPEWYMGGNTRSFMNWNTRQTLLKALAYHQRWEAYEKGLTKDKPEFDPTWDGFRGLFRRDFPVTVHTQIYQVVMTTVEMLAKGLKLWVVLDHSEFDGWKVGPLLRDTDAFVICGPRGFHFDRTANRMVGFAAAWQKNGVDRIGYNTDAPVIPQEELSYQATMSCWYGWLPYTALRGVTALPAKALGIYNRLGSIEPGKDADFAVWTGDPLDPRSQCLMTIVSGKIVYDASKGVRRF